MKRFTPAAVSVSVVFFLSIILTLPLIISLVQNSQSLLQHAAVLPGPPPQSGKQFNILRPGASLPSDADCATRLRQTTWEPRPANTTQNQYIPVKGSDYNLPLYSGTDNGIYLPGHAQLANAFVVRVDGDFRGTTDEVLQWAACKWGFDEDIARAQAVVESFWQMSAVGDNGQSFGILQIRSHAGTMPAAQKSTAFNADYTFMRWRLCYEGLIDYLGEGTTYAAGDQWGCVGVWYTGNWYGPGGGLGDGAQSYINKVKGELVARQWESWAGTNPSAAPTIQPTGIQTGTRLTVTLFLHGIGKGGDNVNQNSTGTTNPLHPTRSVVVELANSANQPTGTFQGIVTYAAASGNFLGTINLGAIPAGVYTAKVKVPQYLKRSFPGILSISPSPAIALATVGLSLTTGDTNSDNALSILDYNLILDCFSDLAPARNCTDPTKKLATDLTDDGNVNQFDYNLFLRELSVQSGG